MKQAENGKQGEPSDWRQIAQSGGNRRLATDASRERRWIALVRVGAKFLFVVGLLSGLAYWGWRQYTSIAESESEIVVRPIQSVTVTSDGVLDLFWFNSNYERVYGEDLRSFDIYQLKYYFCLYVSIK